jgi:hypothetical protein
MTDKSADNYYNNIGYFTYKKIYIQTPFNLNYCVHNLIAT